MCEHVYFFKLKYLVSQLVTESLIYSFTHGQCQGFYWTHGPKLQISIDLKFKNYFTSQEINVYYFIVMSIIDKLTWNVVKHWNA